MNGKTVSLVALLVFAFAIILPAQGQAQAVRAPRLDVVTDTPTATVTTTSTETATPTATGTATLATCGLLDKLVSYWKLDEASGDAVDSVGTNTLTAHNAPGTATGVVNGLRLGWCWSCVSSTVRVTRPCALR